MNKELCGLLVTSKSTPSIGEGIKGLRAPYYKGYQAADKQLYIEVYRVMTDINFKTLIKQLKLGENQDEVYIKGNVKVPEIYLNKKKGIIQFRGRALPENAKELFIPIFNWIEMYLQAPNITTLLVFKLEYFNTSSSKMLTEIIKKLKKLSLQGKELIIEWHYPEDDEDVLESGEAFEEITNINFKYCPYDATYN